MKKIMLLLSILFFLVFCSHIFADTLYLKNGSKLVGKTIRQDAEKVLFSIGEGEDAVEVTFFSDEVLRIDKAEVSSFITVPFGRDKQLSIPRPIFTKEPPLAEQAHSQSRQQLIEGNQTEDQIENLNQNVTMQLPPQASESLSNITQSESFLKGKNVVEELTGLLNEEEKKYFTKINSTVKDSSEKMMAMLSNLPNLAKDGNSLLDSMQQMPQDIEGIIKQLGNEPAPSLFSNFHKKYLENLAFMKDVFIDISKGDVIGSQSKLTELQNMNMVLQQELENILQQKKNQK